MKSRALYSPLGMRRMEQYQKRMAALVKDGHLKPHEAKILCHEEMTRIIDRRVEPERSET
jgi:hypothetical protein